MLSIEQCRELISDSDKLTNAEIEEIRSSCYETAQLAFDVWFEKKPKEKAKI